MNIERSCVDACYELARESQAEGGIPIGSTLWRNSQIIGRGHNRRVQDDNPILHGEMDCLKNAGRLTTYRDTTLYTSLSPCMMCSGAIVQFKIPQLVICENVNFGGNEEFLRSRGVDVMVLNEPRFIEMMRLFIDDKPDLWYEDIAAS